jgi:membrane protease YdiL (CAAX protease family)
MVVLVMLLLGSYALAIEALVALRLQGNPRERIDFKNRLRCWRIEPGWDAVAGLSPTAIWFFTFAHCVILGSFAGAQSLRLLFLPLILVSSFGEEVGWRGFLLPRLFARSGPIQSSLQLGWMWWAFHVPLFWQ